MKTYIWFSLTLITLCSLIILSCSKDVAGRTDNLPALNPVDNDLNAGSWKTVLLQRPDTFTIAAPAAITSGTYIGELNEIKGLQQNLTAAQKEIVQYWSAGAILRWNE